MCQSSDDNTGFQGILWCISCLPDMYFCWAYENSWLYKMSGRMTDLTQMEIWVYESADGQLSTVKSCACINSCVHMGTLQTGLTILPRDMGAASQICLCFFSSGASRLVTLTPVSTPLMWLSEHESQQKTRSLCPRAPLNAVSLWELAPSLSQRKAFSEAEMSRANGQMWAAAWWL